MGQVMWIQRHGISCGAAIISDVQKVYVACWRDGRTFWIFIFTPDKLHAMIDPYGKFYKFDAKVGEAWLPLLSGISHQSPCRCVTASPAEFKSQWRAAPLVDEAEVFLDLRQDQAIYPVLPKLQKELPSYYHVQGS